MDKETRIITILYNAIILLEEDARFINNHSVLLQELGMTESEYNYINKWREPWKNKKASSITSPQNS